MPPRSRAVRAVPAATVPTGLAAPVAATLAELDLEPRDAAAAALATRYAQTIDRAAELADLAAAMPYDPDTAAQVSRLRQRVEAHAVMAEVGPRLLAVLESLGATPKARALIGKPAPKGRASKLAELRAGIA